MFARLKKGQVLKSKAGKNGKISYTIILQNKPFFLELYKTVKLYKNLENNFSPLEVRVREYDFTNYTNKIINEKLKLVDNEEEITILKKDIKNLPEKIQNKIYAGGKIELFHTNSDYNIYDAEIQNVSKINSLSEKIGYKKRLISWTLPLGFS